MNKAKFLVSGLAVSGMLVMGGCFGQGADFDISEALDEETEDFESDYDEEDYDDEDFDDEEDFDEEEEPEDEDFDDSSDEDEDSEEESLDYLYPQYHEIVEGLDEKWDMFQFIYLTNDNFPSILVSSSVLSEEDNGLNNYLIITYSNAGAEINEDLRDGVASAGGYRGSLYYVPGTGTVYELINEAPNNNPSCQVSLLDNGHLYLYASGWTEVLEGYEGPDDKEHLKWFWNSDEVSAEEYEENLNEATNNLTGTAFYSIEFMDKTTMLNMLLSE